MKKLLPKNPLAAAGVGVLVGAGIAGYKMWNQYKQGEVTQKEAIAGVVKQGILFGGVAAVSTFAGGQGGGGVGIAAMSVLGLGGGRGGGQGSAMLPGMVTEALGGGGAGRGDGKGQGGGMGASGRQGQGGGQASGLIDSISDSIAELLSPESKALAIESENKTSEESQTDEVEVEIVEPEDGVEKS